MSEKKECRCCLFWEEGGDDDMGECHRFPPVLEEGNKYKDISFRFPETFELDWCGEYRNKTQHSLETGGPWK